jgi:hypothetical protein
MAIVEVEGQQFEFPEGTPDEVIGNAIRAHFGEQPPVEEPVEEPGFAAYADPLLRAAGLPEISTAETAATIGTGIVAEPVAGLVGLASLPFTDPEQAEKNVEAVRSALTYIPKTEEGMAKLQKVAEILEPVGKGIEWAEKGLGQAAYEATEAPIAGALAETVPAAAMEAMGLGAVKRAAKAGKAAKRAAKTEIPKEIPKKVEPELKSYTDIKSNLERKRAKPAAEQVRPDAQILKDAEDLNVVVNPSAYSTNRAYIEIEQGLKSRPGSKLSTVEEKSIIDIGNRADDLISDLGGVTDKSLLDLDVRGDFLNTIDKLEKKASTAYDAVSNVIPSQTRLKAPAVTKYLDDALSDLGGDATLLTGAERKLLALTREGKAPTYAAIDRIRKDVGQGFRKGSGPFKDDAEGTLKQVYKVLSKDQQGIADAFGVGAEYQAARKLVASRKDLEKSAQSLLGRELNNSIVPKLTAAATALTKGDVSKFRKLMNSLPKQRRAEVAATMLNDIFASGARKKGAIGQGFTSAFDGLNRNKEAKSILFSHLPKNAQQRFNKIGRVASGIYKSKALENTSRTARDIIAAMEDGGLFGKVLAAGERMTPLPGTGTSLVGIGSGLLRKTPATMAADNFITSPAFRKAIETAARGGDAEKIVSKSQLFKKWLKTVSPNEAAQITTVGFIPWITGQTEERE